jgi:ankyrin repeat protein
MTKSHVLRLGQFIFAIGVCVSGCANRTVNQATLDQQLLEAAEKPDVAAVRQLLRKGAKVGAKNESHWTALDEAAARGD